MKYVITFSLNKQTYRKISMSNEIHIKKYVFGINEIYVTYKIMRIFVHSSIFTILVSDV